ncbi:MAG: 23S rRNA (pseudouridine(1915)-N(3))-methyltransferase RlmH [bacterium]
MKLTIVAVGNKAPAWVKAGYEEYARRFPRELSLDLIEIPAPRHHRDPARFKQLEGEKMLGCVAVDDWVVALEERGRALTSAQLAEKLSGWQMSGHNVVFLIGGSDGLAEIVLNRANERMSLSSLTFPHYVVRVILAEALYRARSIGTGHPYHRA